MTTDPIAAARAMIEPLTGYTSAPWAQVSAGDNGYHIGSGGWTVDASDPDGGYFEEYHICKTTGYYDAAGADARLMAASPDLRDMVATLAEALGAERARAEKAEAMLDHTQQWYAERVRKIEDIAKRAGIWPEIAAILANGTASRQMPDGSILYDPPTYAQQLNIAKHRAEKAEALEAENKRLRATLSAITATDCYSRDECTAMARAALNPEASHDD